MESLTRPPRTDRTYVVVAVDETARVRPLGTVAAGCRAAARSLARLLHDSVPAERLRVLAAGSAPGDLVARALALDAR
jgi:hypothetical protein